MLHALIQRRNLIRHADDIATAKRLLKSTELLRSNIAALPSGTTQNEMINLYSKRRIDAFRKMDELPADVRFACYPL